MDTGSRSVLTSSRARCCYELRFAGEAAEAQRGSVNCPGSPSEAGLDPGLPPGCCAREAEGSPARGRMSAWTRRPGGAGLLPMTLTVCFSLPAACYLFNSAREKEGSPVLRDNAHVLAYSPTVCPCHFEIQNHDCLKRGKWRPLTAPSGSGPWERCLFLFAVLPREPGDGYHMGLAASLGIPLPHLTFLLEPSLSGPCLSVELRGAPVGVG